MENKTENQRIKINIWMVVAIFFIIVSLALCVALILENDELQQAKGGENKAIEVNADNADAFEKWKEKYGVNEIRIASENSDKYHRPDCNYAKNIKESNAVYYKSNLEAEKAGKKPCSVCKP